MPAFLEHEEKYGMSEPITLYKDGEALTVTAPSFAKELIARDGWRPLPQGQGGIWANAPEPDDDEVPFDFAPEDDTQEVDVVPVKVKRGRPRKAAK